MKSPCVEQGGTTDWVLVGGGVDLPVNAQPGSFAVHLYARPFLSGDPTPTGLAFFDNVSVVHTPPRPLRSTLVSPVYRGQLLSGAGSPAILVRSHFIFDAATSKPQVTVQLEMRSRPDGKVLWRHVGVDVANVSAALDLNITALMKASAAPALSPGNYALFVSCLNASSSDAARVPMATDSHNLTVLAPSTPTPAVAIDQELRVIIDGHQPFFPIGFIGFCSTLTNASAMAAFRPAGFNSIMPCLLQPVYTASLSLSLSLSASLCLSLSFLCLSVTDAFPGAGTGSAKWQVRLSLSDSLTL